MANHSHDTTIPTSPLRFILYVTKSHRGLLFLVLLFVAITEILVVFNPLVLGYVVDLITSFSNGDTTISLTTIGLFVVLYPSIRLLTSVAIRGGGYALSYLTAHLRTSTYQILFAHLSLHSASYFADRFTGTVSSDVNIGANTMARVIRFFVYNFFALFITITSAFFVMATASMVLAVLFVIGIGLLIPVNYLLSKKTVHLSKHAAKVFSTLRGKIVDSITNIVAVNHFAMRDKELSRLNHVLRDHQEAGIKKDIYHEGVLLINNILVSLFAGGVVFIAFLLWKDGMITVGQLVMILSLSTMVVRNLSHIGNSINDFASMYGEVRHSLQEILKPHDIVDSDDAQELAVPDGAIVFEKVSFSYDDTSRVFDGLSLAINAGERVGIVGPSGGGKTTFVKLLLRQYDIQSGSITIDGHTIAEVTQESLRRAIGIVPQEPLLFHRSLAENIGYGKEDATESEIHHAARRAKIDDFIETLPEKYETLTGERGIKLSGGQRQRVAIARAIVKAAPILVLDEATSALDSESEVAIQHGLESLMEGKTVIAIAHRLSTIKKMDRIIVFEGGTVVQDGSHDELLKDKTGTYARLWNHQAGGFLQEDNPRSVV